MPHAYTYGIPHCTTERLVELMRGAWFWEVSAGFAIPNGMQLQGADHMVELLSADSVDTRYNEMVEPIDMPNIDHEAVHRAIAAQMAFFGLLA